MRFATDENIPPALVIALRALGHDVRDFRDEGPGASDVDLLRRARADERVMVTRDKDFGTLVYRQRARTAGVILLRLPWGESVAQLVAARIDAGGEGWRRQFSVIEAARVRSIPL